MTPTIDTLINTFSLFATVILGVFVFIGGLIVWNGFELRARAEKDLRKIEQTKDEAVKMFLQLQLASEEFRKFSDKSMKSANESIKQLSSLVNEADKNMKNIRDAKEVVKAWDDKYAKYETASQGTAPLFQTSQDLSSPETRLFADLLHKKF